MKNSPFRIVHTAHADHWLEFELVNGLKGRIAIHDKYMHLWFGGAEVEIQNREPSAMIS